MKKILGYMRTSNVRSVFAALFFVLALWVILTPCPRNQVSDGFIKDFWPPQNSQVLAGCYMRRLIFAIPSWSTKYPVSITIRGLAIADIMMITGEEVHYETFDVNKNVTLFVDNKRVHVESVVDGGASIIGYPNFFGTYNLGARTLLLPGTHTATIEIITLSGKSQKFTWQFDIVVR